MVEWQVDGSGMFVLDLFRKWVLDFMGLFTQFCGH